MGDDLKEEVPVSASVNELVFGQRAYWETAQHERPGIEGDILLSLFALFTNANDGVQLLLPSACKIYLGQD
jgi:hypothetical protein